MRIDSVRFGVRTNKTIRKTNGNISEAVEKVILNNATKVSKGIQLKIKDNQMVKSAKNFEKIDKNERKRKLKQDQYAEDEYNYQEDQELEDEIYVDIVSEYKPMAKQGN